MSDPREENKLSNPKRWWETLPAILGGVAAVIAAISGLVMELNKQPILTQSNSNPVKHAAVEQSPGGSQSTYGITVPQDQSAQGAELEPTSRSEDAAMLRNAHKSLDELLKQ